MIKQLVKSYDKNFPEMAELEYILSAAQALGPPRFNFTGDYVAELYENDPERLELMLLAVE